MNISLVKTLFINLAFTALILRGQAISLQAVNGTLQGTKTSTKEPGYTGAGYITHFEHDGDLVRWNFFASNGLYRLKLRYRSPLGRKEFAAILNDTTISGMFPKAEHFEFYDAGLVLLKNGENKLEVGGGWKHYEIDRADLIPANTVPPLPVAATLVDSQAAPEARLLMNDLVAGYGKVTWSGQAELTEVTNIFNLTRHKPVIVCGDLINYSPSSIAFGAKPGQLVESYIAMHHQGHVLSFCWHWNAPTNLLNTPDHKWWRGFYTDATTFDLAAALADTNSTEYHLLLRDIDAIGGELKKLSDEHIPILWRPLHEAEGKWFWWGAKGPESFKKLWRLMFNRLTIDHRLHNLIWVLTNDDPAWYPGDDVVDILGIDAYPSDRSDPVSERWEAMKARFDGKKLIALTEFGGVPDIEKMHRFGVWFSYFSPWSGPYGPTSMPTNTVMRIYQSSDVLTLDEAVKDR